MGHWEGMYEILGSSGRDWLGYWAISRRGRTRYWGYWEGMGGILGRSGRSWIGYWKVWEGLKGCWEYWEEKNGLGGRLGIIRKGWDTKVMGDEGRVSWDTGEILGRGWPWHWGLVGRVRWNTEGMLGKGGLGWDVEGLLEGLVRTWVTGKGQCRYWDFTVKD